MLAKKIQTSFIGFTFTSLVEFEKLNMFWLLDHVPNFSVELQTIHRFLQSRKRPLLGGHAALRIYANQPARPL